MPAAQMADAQVAALRAYLMRHLDQAERLNSELAESGSLTGYGELVYAAFAEAVRRRFSPAWARGDVIELMARANLDAAGLDSFLTDVRVLADRLIAL